jgi:hypothetical protein
VPPRYQTISMTHAKREPCWPCRPAHPVFQSVTLATAWSWPCLMNSLADLNLRGNTTGMAGELTGCTPNRLCMSAKRQCGISFTTSPSNVCRTRLRASAATEQHQHARPQPKRQTVQLPPLAEQQWRTGLWRAPSRPCSTAAPAALPTCRCRWCH